MQQLTLARQAEFQRYAKKPRAASGGLYEVYDIGKCADFMPSGKNAGGGQLELGVFQRLPGMRMSI
jgi:hypothetical protein